MAKMKTIHTKQKRLVPGKRRRVGPKMRKMLRAEVGLLEKKSLRRAPLDKAGDCLPEGASPWKPIQF